MSRNMLCALVSIMMVSGAFGQQRIPPDGPLGKLSGSLSGVSARNLVIILTDLSTGTSERVTPSQDGQFSVALRPGTYRVELERDGVRRTARENFTIPAGGTTQIRVTIEGAPLSQNIEIEADASTVQDEPAEFGRNYTTITVHTLPVPDRNYQELAALMPGVTPPATQFSATFDPHASRQFNSNGLPSYVNDHTSDGISVREPYTGLLAMRILPNEAVQELNVRTTTFPAAQGFASGAITNVFMRPGTNGLHGTLLGFFSDDFLQTRNAFNPAGNPDPTFRHWQFGGLLSGALIPDRLFLSASYQGAINNGKALTFASVPTAATLGGNFSSVAFPIYNPGTGTAAGVGRVAFANNTISPLNISPIAAAYLAFLPAANQPGTGNNLVANVPYGTRSHLPDVRLDYRLSNSFSGFLRYGWSDVDSREASIFGPVLGGSTISALRNHHASVSVEGNYHGILAEFRVGYSRYRNAIANDAFTSLLAATLPAGFVSGSAVPSVTIDGLGTLGTPANVPAKDVDNVYEGGANFHANLRNHQIQFGAAIRDLNSAGFPNAAFSNFGSFYFGPGPTSLAGVQAVTGSALTASFASFLLGTPTTAGIFSYASTPSYHQRQYAGYAGDTVNLFRRLTLDLGLRYELYSPVQMGSPTGATFFDPLTNTVTRGGEAGAYRYGNVAPRVGIAFSAANRTVIRTGYAIHYFPLPFSQLGINASGSGTSLGTIGSFGATAFTVTSLNAAPTLAAQNIPYTVNSLDRTPYVQSYYFLIQQGLPLGFLMDVGYVGNTAKALPYFLPTNVAAPGTGVAGLPFGLARTAAVTAERIGATSKYNSLQVNLTKRLSAGLSFAVAYTFSKALDYGNALANPFSVRANYGLSDFDRTHILTISHVLAVPVGAGTQRWNQGLAGRILASWQASGVFQWATGAPYSVTANSVACNCPGLSSVYANAIAISNIDGQSTIPAGAFSTPAPNTFGTAGRNTFRGPELAVYNLSIFKTFPVMENKKVELRAEAYNLFNNRQFGAPYSNVSLGNFGMPAPSANSAFNAFSGAGRTFRIGARILF